MHHARHHRPIHWPGRQTMIRLTMLAFALLTVGLGAVVVGQDNAQQAADQARDLSIGRDTPVRITLWVYFGSLVATGITVWKVAKWDSKRDKEFGILRDKIEALEKQNAAK